MGIFKNNLYRTAGACSFILLSVAQCLPYSFELNNTKYEITALSVVILALVLALIDWIIIGRKIESEKRIKFQNFTALLKMELKIVSENLKLTENERINIYKYDPSGFFILQARHSESARYKKPGRPAYNENEGAIGLAFNSSEVFHTNLPSSEGRAGKKAYADHCEKTYNMKKGVTKNITMKSRAYAARVIRNKLGDKIAVLLLETINQDFTHLVQDRNHGKILDECRVKSFLERECNRISHIFELHDYSNSIKHAHKEGL